MPPPYERNFSMKKAFACILGLVVCMDASHALASSLSSLAGSFNPVGHSFLYLGGGLVVVSSVLVMFDKRLD